MAYKKKELKLEDFIYQIKKELTDAQKKHEGERAYFELERVELEVTVMVRSGTDGKVHLWVVDVGKDIAKEDVHRVKLSFGIVEAKQKASNKVWPIKSNLPTGLPPVTPFGPDFMESYAHYAL